MATDAVAPEKLVARHLARDGRSAVLHDLAGCEPVSLPLPLFIAGAGKAAARMASGCTLALGEENVRGLVITADGCEVPLETIECVAAGHPLPDRRGVEGVRRMIEALGAASDPILFLLSGGASSLLVQPRPPVSLADKIATSSLLLDSGAEITEFNTVRKHLSVAKGGGLLRCAAGPVWTLTISDVVGDDLAVIGSGPTVADPTTYEDALTILRRHGLLERVPPSVRQLLEAGRAGAVEETVKPSDPEAGRSHAFVVGSNRIALHAAADWIEGEGWIVERLEAPLEGETAAAAALFAARLESIAAAGRKRVCLIAGGETTVRVTGSGRGGRNQEFALALLERLEGRGIHVLSAGSDGIDGPTDAAGAFVDGTSAAGARALRIDPAAALADNDSYGFFAQLGDLFQPGATGTNVADLKFALVG